MRDRRHEYDPLAALRRRLIKETEIALLYGLRFPDRHARIPTVEVGHGEFDPAFAAQWWADAIGLDGETMAACKPGRFGGGSNTRHR
jgi:hypothetical protein